MDYADQIRQYVSEGNTKRALELLRQSTRKGTRKHRDAILLSSKYQQWERDRRVGVSGTDTTLRQIERAILDILDDNYAEVDTGAAAKKPNIWWPIVVVLLLMGAAFLIYQTTQSDSDEDVSKSTVPSEQQSTEPEEPATTPERLIEVPTTLNSIDPNADPPTLQHPDLLMGNRIRFVVLDRKGEREILRMTEFGGWTHHTETGRALNNFTEKSRDQTSILLEANNDQKTNYRIDLNQNVFEQLAIPLTIRVPIIETWPEPPSRYIKSVAFKNELGVETYLIKQILGGWKLRKGMLVSLSDLGFEQIDLSDKGIVLRKNYSDEYWYIDLGKRQISVRTGSGPYRKLYDITAVF